VRLAAAQHRLALFAGCLRDDADGDAQPPPTWAVSDAYRPAALSAIEEAKNIFYLVGPIALGGPS
jgi:hypothetical protein